MAAILGRLLPTDFDRRSWNFLLIIQLHSLPSSDLPLPSALHGTPLSFYHDLP